MSDRLPPPLRPLDTTLTTWMARHGVLLLRISLGVCFLWFGLLKYFPQASPAEELAFATIDRLAPAWVSRDAARIVLATWEVLIGIGLVFGRLLRVTLLLLFLQMLGAISPVFLLPERVFVVVPFVPTLEGQYIVKNIVLVSAAIVIGATVRGGRLVAEADGMAGKRAQGEATTGT